jgi:hypothetical protein
MIAEEIGNPFFVLAAREALLRQQARSVAVARGSALLRRAWRSWRVAQVLQAHGDVRALLRLRRHLDAWAQLARAARQHKRLLARRVLRGWAEGTRRQRAQVVVLRQRLLLRTCMRAFGTNMAERRKR